MDKQPYFGYGASIFYRGVDEFGEIIDVKPVTVVEDTNERAVLWLEDMAGIAQRAALWLLAGGP